MDEKEKLEARKQKKNNNEPLNGKGEAVKTTDFSLLISLPFSVLP